MTEHLRQPVAPSEPCLSAGERLEQAVLRDPMELAELLKTDEHLRGCNECRDLAESLAFVAQSPACPSALVASALREVAARRRARRTGWIVSGAAAAVALFALALLVRQGSPAESGLDPRSLALRLTESDDANATPFPEGRANSIDSNTLYRTADAALGIALAKGSALEASRLRRDGVELVLHRGLLAVDLDPAKRIPLTIRSGDALIRITGTVLFVDAARQSVGVLEGSIEVTRGQQPATAVRAGQSLSLATGELRPVDSSTRQEIRALLEQENTVATALPAPERETAFLESNASAKDEDTTNQAPVAVPSTRRTLNPSTVRPDEPAAAEPAPRASEPAKASANWLAEARRCRAARDWSCAADRYKQAMSSAPGSSEALMATVSLAELELDHLARPEQALAHFEEYLAKAPRGVLAPEAMYGRCRALGTSGRVTAEKSALEAFVAAYPDSPYARSARSRLEYLANH